jgi:hypothetical protein
MSEFEIKEAEAKVVITGTLVFRDKEGNIVGQTEMTAPVQLDTEAEDGDMGE